MLDICGLSVQCGGRILVNDVSFRVGPASFTAIIGPNGAGKSTLLKAISGEQAEHAGCIQIGGKSIAAWPRRDLARQMAVMGQTPSVSFDFSVRDLIELGRAPWRGHAASIHNRAIIDTAVELADLKRFEHRFVPSLSGGESQRTFFAKAVAQLMDRPESMPGRDTLLLLDEPTSALDLAQQSRVMGAARQIADSGSAVLAVLHDLNLAAAYADEIVVMVDGRLQAIGAPDAVFSEAALARWYGCDVNVFKHPETGVLHISV